MYEGRRLLMVKRRKKRNKFKPKLTYSYFVNKRLKDFGLVFLFFLIIAFFRGADELIIWLSMSLLILIGIFINARSEYKEYLK